MDLTAAVENLGFVAVGVTPSRKPLFFEKFRAWIEAGNHGDMAWLARHMALRADPARLLEGCQTVVTLAYPYSAVRPATPDGFFAARYTEPRKADYHQRVKKRAAKVARWIKTAYPDARTRVCIDSAPILERSFAFSAGIGFIGRNNMLIVPEYGSYVFLVEVLTSAHLTNIRATPVDSGCGDCRRCVDACPTGALSAPFCMDASQCLSYQTIEMKTMVDLCTGKKMERCFFGCDVCQEVCPFNKKEDTNDICLPALEAIRGMDDRAFDAAFGKTAFARAGLRKIQGNIAAMSRNI